MWKINYCSDVVSPRDIEVMEMVSNSHKKIELYKIDSRIYTRCIFCNHDINVEFEPLYDSNEVEINGKCKWCNTMIRLKTHRDNYISNWSY